MMVEHETPPSSHLNSQLYVPLIERGSNGLPEFLHVHNDESIDRLLCRDLDGVLIFLVGNMPVVKRYNNGLLGCVDDLDDADHFVLIAVHLNTPTHTDDPAKTTLYSWRPFSLKLASPYLGDSFGSIVEYLLERGTS